MKVRLLAACLVASMLALAGCGMVRDAAKELEQLGKTVGEKTADTVQQAVEAADTPEPEVDEFSAGVPKFNAYIEISDILNNRMDLCLTGYEERICALNKQFSVKRKGFSGWINSIGDYELQAFQESHDFASETPRMEPVDGMFLDLEPVATDIIDALHEAYEYYESKGYVDDKFAKGEEIHKRLIENIDTYYERARDFDMAVDTMAHERTLQSLDLYKENDQMLMYWSNVFILDAKELGRYLDTVEINKKHAAEIDAEVYRALYDNVAVSQGEFAKIATSEKAEEEGIRMLFSSFKSAVSDFKASAAKIAQKLDEGESVSASDINDVFEEYSDMIGDYNRMIG